MIRIVLGTLIVAGALSSVALAQESTQPTEVPHADQSMVREPAAAEAAPTAESAPAEPTMADRYDAKCEAGANMTRGNSNTWDLASGCEVSRTYAWMKWLAKGGFQYGTAKFGRPLGAAVVSRHQWDAMLREDVFLTDDQRLYLFLVEGFAGNKLAGLLWHFNGELGLGYSYMKTEAHNHKVEVGFQALRETYVEVIPGVQDNEWRLAAFVALLGDVVVTESAKVDYSLRYAPNLQDVSTDTRMNAHAGLTLKINDMLAYSTKGTWAWDSEPNRIPVVDQAGTADSTAVWSAKEHDFTWMNLLVFSLF